MQSAAGFMNRFIDLPNTVALLNKERSNNRLYVSLVQSSPTAYYDDKTMPSLPGSALNVMQTGRASNRTMYTSPETVSEQTSLPFDSSSNTAAARSLTIGGAIAGCRSIIGRGLSRAYCRMCSSIPVSTIREAWSYSRATFRWKMFCSVQK